MPERPTPASEDTGLLHLIHDEIARLGFPEGTVASRLARATEMLGKRLARRAVATSAVMAGCVPGVATACVPSSLVASTIKAAHMMAAGQVVAGVIPPSVAALTTGVMKAMFMSTFTILLAVMSLVGFALGGVGLGVVGADERKASAPVTKRVSSLPAKAPTQRDIDLGKNKVSLKIDQEVSIHFKRDGDRLLEPTILKATDNKTSHVTIKFGTTWASPGPPPRKGAVRPYLELKNNLDGTLQFRGMARNKGSNEFFDISENLRPTTSGNVMLLSWDFDSLIEEVVLDQFYCEAENPLFRNWPKVEGTAVTFDRTMEIRGGVPPTPPADANSGRVQTSKVTYKLAKATPKELTIAVGENTFTIPAQVDEDGKDSPKLTGIEDVKIGGKTYACKVYKYKTSLAEAESQPDGQMQVSVTVWLTPDVPGGIVRRRMSYLYKASYSIEDTFVSSAQPKKEVVPGVNPPAAIPAKPMPPPGFVPAQPPPGFPPTLEPTVDDVPPQRKFALEQKLVGTWIGQGPCVGSTVFDVEGTYHQFGYGPGAGQFESGTWTIDWKELPPTLVLKPLSNKDKKETGYLLMKLNDKQLDFRRDQHEESRIEEHRRGTESDDVAIRIKILDSAVQRYLGDEKHGAGVKLPPSLQTLVDTKILPSAKSLCDPWGGDFQYDVSGKNNKGKKPDIWTETKDKKIIGNWPEVK